MTTRRLDVARVLVSTLRMKCIDEHVNISVVGACYSLWVVEEGWPELQDRQSREKEEKETPSICSSCKVEVVRGVLEFCSGEMSDGSSLSQLSVWLGGPLTLLRVGK